MHGVHEDENHEASRAPRFERRRQARSKNAELKRDEEQEAEEYEKVAVAVIFEALRRDGEYELRRAFGALLWSGVVAGLAISTSVLGKGMLVAILPDAEWAPGITSFGYTLGFLIVILGRMQLFTENTITPILPLFIAPTRSHFFQIARLWGIVLFANLVGCAASALILVHGNIIPEVYYQGMLSVSRHYAEASPMEHFTWGIPAGFLIAALVWILPRMEGAGEVLMIVIVTYFIGLGGMSHVVAGATELREPVGNMNRVLLRRSAPLFTCNVNYRRLVFRAALWKRDRGHS